MLAKKSIKQSYSPSEIVLSLMREFKQMTNETIRIGLAYNNVSTMKRLSKLSYSQLKRYNHFPSYYKLARFLKLQEF